MPTNANISEAPTRNKKWERTHLMIKTAREELINELHRPPTQGEIATKAKLDRETVVRHMKELTWADTGYEELARMYAPENFQHIIVSASKGNSAAQKLLAEMAGKIERHELNVKYEELDDADLERIRTERERRLAQLGTPPATGSRTRKRPQKSS